MNDIADKMLDQDEELQRLINEEKQEKELRQVASIVGSEALCKACFDPFDYALKLKTGEIVRFTEARVINADWIHIEICDSTTSDAVEHNRKIAGIPFTIERGMDIRISDIVWVMDAPNGS